MTLYTLGIGGTGAKCVEGAVHLSAAGVLPCDRLHAMFVDPDQANGSLERAQITLQQYRACQVFRLGRARSKLFPTEITVSEPTAWTPFQGPDPTLRQAFHYDLMRRQGAKAAAADLFDVLYSPAERDTPLDKGFRGHPSIGAAVMARAVNLHQAEPWRTLFRLIQQDAANGQQAHVMLFGSIFGGTGASGVPTIGRLIQNACQREGLSRVTTTAVLLLPYFNFPPPAPDSELQADSRNFMYNTQMALKYYYQRNKLSDAGFRAIYLLGEQSHSTMPVPALGGKEQRNSPHSIEAHAALMAAHLLSSSTANGNGNGNGAGNANDVCRLVARESAGAVEWADLPYAPNWQSLQGSLRRMLRFAASFVFVYRPMLKDIEENGGGYRAPWYIDHFVRHGQSFDNPASRATLKDQLDKMHDYCRSLLLWWAGVQASAPQNTLRLDLVNATAYSKESTDAAGRTSIELKRDGEFSMHDFPQLILPTAVSNDAGLADLWNMVSGVRVREDADGAGWFFSALHEQCAN